jgi:putative ATPase
MHLRNAPTKLMKELDYGKWYKYAHDYPEAKVDQEHFPEELKGRTYLN